MHILRENDLEEDISHETRLLPRIFGWTTRIWDLAHDGVALMLKRRYGDDSAWNNNLTRK